MSTNKVFQIIYAILNTSLWLDIHNETQNLTMYCWIYFYSICCNVRLLHFTIKNYISIWYKWHILQDYLDNITKMQISKSSLFYAGSMYWRYGIAGLLLRFSFEILQWVIYVCKCIYIYIYMYIHIYALAIQTFLLLYMSLVSYNQWRNSLFFCNAIFVCKGL